MAASAQQQRGAWAEEAVDVARAVAGGLLFGIPLLFTMEVWWIGGSTTPARILLVLVLTFVPVFVLMRTGGFRSRDDLSLANAAGDTAETMAIGILIAAALLVLFREIDLDTPVTELLGKVVYEAAPFAIGSALARQLLSRGRDEGGDGDADGEDDEGGNATLKDLGATIVGAVFIAFNVAPTDEVPMLAAQVSALGLVVLIAVSLAVTYAIVFEAGFASERQRRHQQGALQHPVTETVAAYLVSLVSAAIMLWFFDRVGAGEPATTTLAYTVVLGLPAAVGGAAGRLAV